MDMTLEEYSKLRREVFGWADDLAGKDLYKILCDDLPVEPVAADGTVNPMWFSGDSILCDTEERANIIADWLDEHGYEAVTGWYDPREDIRNDAVDVLTGWYYVDV